LPDEFDRACASNSSGVASNQLVKPLAMEKVEMVQRIMATTKLNGYRTDAAVQMHVVTQARGSRNPT
jgi:hypothetical protein